MHLLFGIKILRSEKRDLFKFENTEPPLPPALISLTNLRKTLNA